MKVVPFPGGSGLTLQDERWLTDLDAALFSGARGAEAEQWRALCEDVRAGAPAPGASFVEHLGGRLSESGAADGRRRRVGRRLSWPEQLRGRWLYGALAPALVAVVVAVLIFGSFGGGASQSSSSSSSSSAGSLDVREKGVLRAEGEPAPEEAPAFGSASTGSTVKGAERTPAVAPHSAQEPAPTVAAPSSTSSAGSAGSDASSATEAEEAAPSTTSSNAAAAPGRVQETAAALTLSTSDVQGVADRVARLVVSEGGFVVSSQVHTQSTPGGEAQLTLRVPSAKLAQALGALARIAPVRSESQSLQDITNEYDTARHALADAEAEHRSLLRALGEATTSEKIEALKAQLAGARARIAHAHAGVQAISRRADMSRVEVGVYAAAAHHDGKQSTLHRALHDALRVLIVTLAVLLVAAAVLVPLMLLGGGAFAGRRAWLRRRREQALQ
jgi:hypothetical protein